MVKGIIFDIDGVIIDSEALHMEALCHVFEAQQGVKLAVNTEELIGLSLEDTLERCGVPADKADVVKKAAAEYYKEHVRAELLRPQIPELFSALTGKGVPFGFVSSAEMDICKSNIGLLNLEQPVPIVSGDTLEHTKPHPMPYLAMLDILRLEPDEAMVVEDSDVGITSAYAAGIRQIFGWPHALSSTQTYQKASQVITGLDQIAFFKGIFSGKA